MGPCEHWTENCRVGAQIGRENIWSTVSFVQEVVQYCQKLQQMNKAKSYVLPRQNFKINNLYG